MKLKFVDEEIYGSKSIKCQIITKKKVFTIDIIQLINCSTQKEDEIEEYLRKRYADESLARRHFGDGGEEMSNEITQQTLLPAIK